MANPNSLLSVLVISMAIIGASLAQRNQSCDVQRSLIDNNKVDVHCDCMQRLNQMNLTISQLTINQTGCSETGLELSWPELETLVAPDALIIAGAQVFFATRRSERSWNSSIRQLKFIDSEIKELPANVFRGMNLLQEVRLFGSAVEIIRSDAFSNLEQLKVVEIANGSITRIEEDAFTNLPALEDLAFIYSFIGSIETGAISLLTSQSTVRRRCPDIGRSVSEPKEIIGDIMGRELTSVGNLSLPEYGTRLFIFKNNIITINSKAVNSKTLGFLIVGGNHIMTIEPEAFNMELYNECEISAALFVGNTIETLNSLSFLGLRGKDGASYQTFIALANNTFLSVFEQGFRLSENLVIFAVEENQFNCDCDGFGWILSNSNSQTQKDLEREIVLKATCLDGTNLISFTSSCTDHGKTTVTDMTTTEGPTRATSPGTGTPPPADVTTTEGATRATSSGTSTPPQADVITTEGATRTTEQPEGNSASAITFTTSFLTFVICHLLL